MTINDKQYLYSVLAYTVRVKPTALSDPAAQDSQFILEYVCHVCQF